MNTRHQDSGPCLEEYVTPQILSYGVVQSEGLTVLLLVGALLDERALALMQIIKLLRRQPGLVVINLEAVPKISSRCARLLRNLQRVRQAHGDSVRFILAPATLREQLNRTADSIYPNFPDSSQGSRILCLQP